jgi:hypothetical protein
MQFQLLLLLLKLEDLLVRVLQSRRKPRDEESFVTAPTVSTGENGMLSTTRK